MISILGKKRIFVLFILVLINVALVFGVYMYLLPQKIGKEHLLRTVRSQINVVQSDIGAMQIEFEQLESQQAEFDRLKSQGFFSSQGRRQAETVFDDIQNKAGVISAKALVSPGVIIKDSDADKADYSILESKVSVKLGAVDDIDIFKYLYLVDKFFPGHMSLEKIEVIRKSEVTGTVLRSIASGKGVPLVTADVEMSWRTMIPQSEVITGDN